MLYLPLVFAHFLHITLFSLKTHQLKIDQPRIDPATTTGIFYVLKAANVKPPKASLDAMDIVKRAGGIVGGVLVKDYAVYKKWINE